MLRSYRRVLIPEMNMGQLLLLVRARYLIDAVGYDGCAASRSASPRSWTRPNASSRGGIMTDTDGHATTAVPAQPALSPENAAVIS